MWSLSCILNMDPKIWRCTRSFRMYPPEKYNIKIRHQACTHLVTHERNEESWQLCVGWDRAEKYGQHWVLACWANRPTHTQTLLVYFAPVRHWRRHGKVPRQQFESAKWMKLFFEIWGVARGEREKTSLTQACNMCMHVHVFFVAMRSVQSGRTWCLSTPFVNNFLGCMRRDAPDGSAPLCPPRVSLGHHHGRGLAAALPHTRTVRYVSVEHEIGGS